MRLSAQVSALLSCGFRIFLLILGFVLFSLSSPVEANAQADSLPNYARPNVESDVPQNQHTLVQSVTIEVMAAIICQLSGIDVIDPEKGCLGINSSTQKLGYAPQQSTTQLSGLLGASTHMVSILYRPPVQTTEFTQHLASNFGFVKSAQAQTTGTEGGFTSLSPMLTLFEFSRNLVYLLFIIVFVLIGIGIMLRVKIDPKTVMSVQNQIPKIIIGLVLITFSYAIAGILVDAMWIGTYFGINTLTEQATNDCRAGDNTVQFVATTNLLNNPFAYVRDLFSDAGCFGSFDGISGLAHDVGSTLGDVVTITIMQIIGLKPDEFTGGCDAGIDVGWSGYLPEITTGVGDCVQYYAFQFVSFFIGLIVMLIVMIAMIVALFKVWFSLLRAYVYVIIDVITAPFWILAGLRPDSTLGFQNWLRHLGAHLAVFPATAIIFVTAFIFATNGMLNIEGEPGGRLAPNTFVPPLLGNPLINNNFGVLIAFGLILVAPNMLDMVRDALKSPKGKYVGPAIASGFASGSRIPRSITSMTGSYLFGKDLRNDRVGPARHAIESAGTNLLTRAPGGSRLSGLLRRRKISNP